VAPRKRRCTVEQKLEMLGEARAPGATVVEVCRRHGIDGTTFYWWEKQAKVGMREALNGRLGPPPPPSPLRVVGRGVLPKANAPVSLPPALAGRSRSSAPPRTPATLTPFPDVGIQAR
jgi:transposase-like protein